MEMRSKEPARSISCSIYNEEQTRIPYSSSSINNAYHIIPNTASPLPPIDRERETAEERERRRNKERKERKKLMLTILFPIAPPPPPPPLILFTMFLKKINTLVFLFWCILILHLHFPMHSTRNLSLQVYFKLLDKTVKYIVCTLYSLQLYQNLSLFTLSIFFCKN